MIRRCFVVVAASVAATVLTPNAVLAFYSAMGSGAGTVAVGVLATPGAPTVPSAAAGGVVPVSWNGVAGPTSPPVAYWIRRHNGAVASDACGSSAAAPLFAGTGSKSCNDSGVAAGTYTYTVTAVWQSWSQPSAGSGSVVVS